MRREMQGVCILQWLGATPDVFLQCLPSFMKHTHLVMSNTHIFATKYGNGECC